MLEGVGPVDGTTGNLLIFNSDYVGISDWVLSRTDCGRFDLLGLDVVVVVPAAPPIPSVGSLVAWRDGAYVTSAQITVGSSPVVPLDLSLAGFTDIDRVTIRGNSLTYAGLDNFHVVPEPATAILLLAGLLAMGRRSRR